MRSLSPSRAAGAPWIILLSIVMALGCNPPAADPVPGADGVDTAPPEDLATQLWTLIGDPEPYILPGFPSDESDLSAFPQDPKNPLTMAKILLGKELFFETGLVSVPWHESGIHTASCASCHYPSAAFGSGSSIGRGFGEGGIGDLEDRVVRAEYVAEGADPADLDICRLNEQRVVNIAWHADRSGWEGRLDSVDPTLPGIDPNLVLEEGYQALEAFAYNGLNQHRMWTNDERVPPGSVLSQNGSAAAVAYKALYDAAFPDVPVEQRITKTTTALALAAVARTITTSEAPFQQFLRLPPGTVTDLPMSEEALAGAVLFFGEARCVQCHEGRTLSGDRFVVTGARYANEADRLPIQADAAGDTAAASSPTQGESVIDYMNSVLLYPEEANMGRTLITNDPADLGAFAIPTVYGAGNVHIQRWGHGGYHTSLEAFLAFKVGAFDPDELDPALAALRSPVLSGATNAPLNDEQIRLLATFVREGLEDTTLEERFGQTTSLAGLPTPNNDL